MIDDAQPLLCSVVVALGAKTAPALAAVHGALAELAGRDDAELIVVENGLPAALRSALARLTGENVRVLHSYPALSTRGALTVGALLARGSVLVVLGEDVVLTAGSLAALLAGFGTDPGLGFVLPTVRSSSSPFNVPLRATPPLVAFTRLALDSIGGAQRLSDTADAATPNVVAHRRGALVPDAVFDDLAAAGWRRGSATVGLELDDGLVTLDNDPLAAAPTDRLHWSPPALSGTRARGLNVVGLLEAVCGIGDAGRRYVEAIAATEIDYSTYSYHGHSSPEIAFNHVGTPDFGYDTNLFVLNPDLLLPFGLLGGEELWADRYTIGLWFWELETVNDAIRRGYRFVNEIWASTNFIRDALASETDKTVRTVPLPVRRREGHPGRSRAELLMPDAFTFLTIFDFGSVADRKNSVGVVRAFRAAFEPGEGPVLVLKTLNAAWDRAGWQTLLAEVGGRRDIVVLDGYLSDEAVSEMIGNADCYVSLHRAEGFGLTPAEAMAWGRPVIATGYSGNLDFMTPENSYLVGFDEAHVPDSLARVYPAGARWAEPRLAEAVRAMREVYASPATASAKGLRAQRDIRRTNGTKRVAAVIAERFAEIGRERYRSTPAPRRAPSPRPVPAGPAKPTHAGQPAKARH